MIVITLIIGLIGLLSFNLIQAFFQKFKNFTKIDTNLVSIEQNIKKMKSLEQIRNSTRKLKTLNSSDLNYTDSKYEQMRIGNYLLQLDERTSIEISIPSKNRTITYSFLEPEIIFIDEYRHCKIKLFTEGNCVNSGMIIINYTIKRDLDQENDEVIEIRSTCYEPSIDEAYQIESMEIMNGKIHLEVSKCEY
jgi:hypothetical protein